MILLMGHKDHGGNLVIDSSDEFPDDIPASVIDALVDEQDDEDGMAWGASFLVDTHRKACQQAYAEYVEDEGGRLIDNVHGILIDA